MILKYVHQILLNHKRKTKNCL